MFDGKAASNAPAASASRRVSKTGELGCSTAAVTRSSRLPRQAARQRLSATSTSARSARSLDAVRFDARVWFLRDVPPICPLRARLQRQRGDLPESDPPPAPREETGRERIAGWRDAGRRTTSRPGRAGVSTAPGEGRRGRSVDAAAAAVRSVASRHGAGRSQPGLGRLTVETSSRRTLAAVIKRIVVVPHERKGDALLIRRDKSERARRRASVSAPDAAAAAAWPGTGDGRGAGLVVVGEDPGGGILPRARGLGRWWSPTGGSDGQASHVALPICAWGGRRRVRDSGDGASAPARVRPPGDAGRRACWPISGCVPARRLVRLVVGDLRRGGGARARFAGLSYRALGPAARCSGG